MGLSRRPMGVEFDLSICPMFQWPIFFLLPHNEMPSMPLIPECPPCPIMPLNPGMPLYAPNPGMPLYAPPM